MRHPMPMPPQSQGGLLSDPSPQAPMPSPGGPPPGPQDGGQSSQAPDPSQMLMQVAQQLKINPGDFKDPGSFLAAILKAAPMPQVAALVDAMAQKLGIPSPAAAMQGQGGPAGPGGQQPMAAGPPAGGGGLLS